MFKRSFFAVLVLVASSIFANQVEAQYGCYGGGYYPAVPAHYGYYGHGGYGYYRTGYTRTYVHRRTYVRAPAGYRIEIKNGPNGRSITAEPTKYYRPRSTSNTSSNAVYRNGQYLGTNLDTKDWKTGDIYVQRGSRTVAVKWPGGSVSFYPEGSDRLKQGLAKANTAWSKEKQQLASAK